SSVLAIPFQMKLAPRHMTTSNEPVSNGYADASARTHSISVSSPASRTRRRAASSNSSARSTQVIRQPNAPARTSAGPARPDPRSSTSDAGPSPSRSPSSRIFSRLVGFWRSWPLSTTAWYHGMERTLRAANPEPSDAGAAEERFDLHRGHGFAEEE